MLLKQVLVLMAGMLLLVACNQAQKSQSVQKAKEDTKGAMATVQLPDDLNLEKIVKSEEEWKSEMGDDEFYVLRKAGTERAFTGEYWNNKEEGIYVCGGCQLPLFASATKFKSGTGWPSFWEPIKTELVAEKSDNSHGMRRVEVLCARCDGHLGHVFPDGPKPTGLRYCINSLSLDFVAQKDFENQLGETKK